MNLEENSCRNHDHRGKNGRNHEYQQDSNDSASTPEICWSIIDIIGPRILTYSMIVLFNIDQKLSIYNTLENLL